MTQLLFQVKNISVSDARLKHRFKTSTNQAIIKIFLIIKTMSVNYTFSTFSIMLPFRNCTSLNGSICLNIENQNIKFPRNPEPLKS